ncbi:MAG: armadillo-type protein, partial [Olpidium bornovanus]
LEPRGGWPLGRAAGEDEIQRLAAADSSPSNAGAIRYSLPGGSRTARVSGTPGGSMRRGLSGTFENRQNARNGLLAAGDSHAEASPSFFVFPLTVPGAVNRAHAVTHQRSVLPVRPPKKKAFLRLKDLIKALRAAKTAADERALIQRESANIRTAFKEENHETRHANIAKLLYIHMLSYPAHFGQIECLKLVASNRFTDKRLGYLGIMLLLDENQEVLTLVTNSLKKWMSMVSCVEFRSRKRTSKILCADSDIALLSDFDAVKRDRQPSSPVFVCVNILGYGRFSCYGIAALCAIRVVRKIPEIHESFVTKVVFLLSDRNHGVLLTGVTLITELCAYSPENLQLFRKLGDLTEPGVLGLRGLPGRACKVATNTESTKNVGNAILYETVLTIMEIESDSGLRVLAINILGRFLSNRDNNIRYVALMTLNKTVAIDTNAVQRHRNIILDCLRDADISIRRRALDLSFALVNESNVRVLTRELLAFLEVADA